jgi:hypothetical protein
MDEDFIIRRESYKRTCADFQYAGVDCCPDCHDPILSDYSLRVVKIDGVNALLCCTMVAFFYPRDPGRGMSPEEKLLLAIFGGKVVHDAAVKYIDTEILDPDYEGDEFGD